MTYITGTFQSVMTIDTITVTPNGAYDAFLAKLNTDGKVQWVQQVGGANNETGLSIALDNSGNVFLGGIYNSQPMIVGSDTLPSNGWGHDALFLVKFNSSGSLLWARNSTGPGTQGDAVYGLACDASGNVYGTGYFQSATIGFGPHTLTNMGGYDLFLFSYDPSGNAIWADRYGSSGGDFGYRLGIDNQNNLLVGGWFDSDTLEIGSTDLVNAGGQDAFVARFNTSGTPSWARQSTGLDDENILGLDVDKQNGRVFTTGRYKGTGVFGGNNFSNAGDTDMFLVVYDSSGNVLWYESEGTAAYDDGRSVSVLNGGEVVVAGTFQGDTLSFGGIWVENGGATDIFLAKFDQLGNLDYLKGVGGVGLENDAYVSTDTSGHAYLLGVYSSSFMMDAFSISNPGGRTNFLGRISTQYVGIEDGFMAERIGLYPNPSHNGRFFIQARGGQQVITSCQVFSMDGRLVSEAKVQNQVGEPVVLELAEQGVFLVRVEFADGSRQSGRIVNLR